MATIPISTTPTVQSLQIGRDGTITASVALLTPRGQNVANVQQKVTLPTTTALADIITAAATEATEALTAQANTPATGPFPI